ncbi:MAG: rRNA processing protein RimM [Pseudomonadota bacterium]
MPESPASVPAGTIVVGQIVGVFGVKGWLKIKSFTDPADNVLRYRPWFLSLPEGLREFAVEEYALRPQGIAVKLKGISDRDQALALGKASIQVEREQLPALDAGEYYWSQLIGLRVVSRFAGVEKNLGVVKGLLETGSNDVLQVQGDEASIDQTERLIPYLPGQFVVDVNLALGIIRVDWDPDF